jgi:hypothetical protein
MYRWNRQRASGNRRGLGKRGRVTTGLKREDERKKETKIDREKKKER